MKLKEIGVSAPQEYILGSLQDYNLFMAGAGSGKTHIMGLLSADLIRNYPHMVGFIGANTYDQLNKSTLKRIFSVWKDTFGWINEVNYVVDRMPPKHFKPQEIKLKSYKNTICFDNGALIFTASLDNYRMIDGQELGWAMLDETKDTDQEAIDEVIVWRLRQPGMWVNKDGELVTTPDIKGYNPLFIFTSPAKEQWLNEMFGLDKRYEEIEKRIFSKDDFFHMEENNCCVVISSSFHNEENLPPGFIQSRLEKFKGNPHLVDTLIYGSPVSKVGDEFYHQFKRSIHVKKITELSGRRFHLVSDQNVNPYFTLLCVQISYEQERYKVRFLKEYCLPNPRNNMESVCKAWASDYGELCDSIFYYGDVSGKIQGTMRETTEHHYDVLEDVLRKWINQKSDRLLRQNPSLIKRRDFGNGILAGAYPIDIEIDESCINLIADMEYMKEDKDGGKLKKKVKDKHTEKVYEKYGHTSDCFDYILCSAFNEFFMEFIKATSSSKEAVN